MKNSLRWLARLVLLVPSFLFAIPAVSKFQSGLAIDAAFPVPVYTSMNVPLPRQSYQQAAEVLSMATDADGSDILARAEAITLSGGRSAEAAAIAKEGLARSPASARGWLVLAENTESSRPDLAAKEVGLALSLAPFDYWIAGRRAADAWRLWSYLDADARFEAERQARLLWNDIRLHEQLSRLLSSNSGKELMADALASDPEAMKALSHWPAEQ